MEWDSKAILSFEDYAARVIQSWWKNLTNISRSNLLKEDISLKKKVLDAESAAIMIQRVWRKHNVRLSLDQ